MKNFRAIYLFAALLAFTVWGCQKEYESNYRVTYFPDFEVKGASVIWQTFGQPFTDPGVKATESGSEIPVTTTITGDFFGGSSVDVNSADRYLINYTATNSDGFQGSVSRTVYVVKNGDLVNSIEGLYTSTVVRNGASGAAYTNMAYIMISKSSDNTYKLSDAIGGYYDLGRGYGAGYRATGTTITANSIAGNDFGFGSPIGVGVFGGVLTMESMTVDSAAKTIVFSSTWDAGYEFVVTLKQVQL
jgi:hypothetical protein